MPRIHKHKELKSLFGQGNFITQFPSLITHNSSLITQFFTSVWHHHPISITQYFSHYLWAPHLSLCQSTSVLLPAEHFHPIKISLFSFPLPLQPCHSPKPRKISQAPSPRQSSGPSSLVNNTQLSNVYSDVISSIVTHFPAATTRKPKPIKISQAPSLRQDHHQWTTPNSPTCTVAWSPPLWPISQRHRRATTTTSPISPFCHGRSLPTQDGATSSLERTLSPFLFIWFVWFAFGFWEK